ncbi:hypothetical protein SAMN02910414_02414 [Lachnobacterium bovis DSM 14045]|uniref:Uncharacterized protein n=1 Tax=Lachnobacterium bovis DSM 14045 TaxID=1122142 RepID=A0A1H3MVU5_9FIRM|nr:hypothetical protein SAMN02910414_02414 [Lachnobacterium bovis DSM 14045]
MKISDLKKGVLCILVGSCFVLAIKCQVFMYKKFYIIMYNYSDGLI